MVHKIPFCICNGNIKNAGSMCDNNPDPKKKCRECTHLVSTEDMEEYLKQNKSLNKLIWKK